MNTKCNTRSADSPFSSKITQATATNTLQDLPAVNPTADGIALETLEPLDAICVHTLNSDYRIFLLDPMTGRAIIQGGRYFAEPVDAQVIGSTLHGTTFKLGWIGVGMRIEFWTKGRLASTSPVQSFRVEKANPT
jgi:hypothetical protein